MSSVIHLKPPDEGAGLVKDEVAAQTRKRVQRRNKYRNTVCQGCRQNYYNFPKPSDGWNVGVAENGSCWHIAGIKRGKCPAHS